MLELPQNITETFNWLPVLHFILSKFVGIGLCGISLILFFVSAIEFLTTGKSSLDKSTSWFILLIFLFGIGFLTTGVYTGVLLTALVAVLCVAGLIVVTIKALFDY